MAEPNNEEESEYRRFTEARWDSPVIITTMVRFLETVMSARAGDLRRFHNIENSVIVFDEVQSVPINSKNLFDRTVDFLCKMLNCTVILCTTTQPRLNISQKDSLSEALNLIDLKEDYKRIFRRTNIVFAGQKTVEEAAEFALCKAKENGGCLFIVNTKKTAQNIFQYLKDKNEMPVLHLSTSMCPAHRKYVLDELKVKLGASSEKKGFICVSTQLIEAGVDIFFPCVIRAAAGMDSILQSAGRCNRSGESEIKDVYIVDINGENLDILPEIKDGKMQTLRILDEMPNANLLDESVLQKYYDYYLYGKKNQMDFNAKGTTVYDMLSSNSAGCRNYKNVHGKDYRGCFRQAFSSASDSYHVIADNTETVIVYYKESFDLIEGYKAETDLVKKIALIKQLEKYGVSVFKGNGLKRLKDMRDIEITQDEFQLKILNSCFYSNDIGITDQMVIERTVE